MRRKRFIVKQISIFVKAPHAEMLPGQWMTACLFAVFFAAFSTAEEAPLQQPSAGNPAQERHRSDPDSLRRAIEDLKTEAQRLRSEAEAVNDSLRGLRFRLRFEIPPTDKRPQRKAVEVTVAGQKDTVQLLSKEGTQAFLATLRGKKRGARERGYGGGLGPTPGIYAINFRPVHELLEVIGRDDEFRNIGFPVEGTWQGFFLMGLTGYGALGNGLRIGGSFRGGSKSYSIRSNDSTYSLEIKTAFGGFLLEKAAVAGSMNWFAGGMAGGANIKVQPSKASGVLSSTASPRDETSPQTFQKLNASSFLIELHGGCTYTMVNWFHVGLDCATPIFFSPSGFRTVGDRSLTNGFVTINPGFRIRIILGNIG